MAKSKSHPQFFFTLGPDFHTHLMIPEDFFMKYIEGTTVEKNIAQVKSDSSDETWKVKMIGRSLSDGWEEFAVANSFETGDMVVVRYEGDLVFNVLDLGPNWSQIPPDITPLRNNNGAQEDIGETLLKKRLYSRTQVVDFSLDDEDDMEIHRKKKVKTNNAETESFLVLVTALNLHTDTMHLPQHLASSNGVSRNCHQIVLKDEGGRSWALDLAFSKSSDTFYISRGWRNFCEDNGQTAGDFFLFKLVENGETPVLNFCPMESSDGRKQSDCSVPSPRESPSTGHNNEEESSEDECNSMKLEKKKYSHKLSSYSPCHKQSVTFTLPPDYVKIRCLSLPKKFLRENGISKPGKIYLLNKDGKKWPTSLLLNNRKGSLKMGSGWKDFVKANGLNTGESFTLKLSWEDTIPVLSLCSAESSSDREREEFLKPVDKQSLSTDPSSRDKICKDENNKESKSWEREKNHVRGRDSTPSGQKQFVTLTITPSSITKCRLGLPKKFTMENDINKLGMITLLGKDGIRQQTKLLFDRYNGVSALGKGWKDFVTAHGLNTGDSFTLKLVWEDTTPVLSLCPAECSIDRGAGGSDSVPSNQKQFVTLKLSPSSFKNCRLTLPSQFVRENSMDKPGMMIHLCCKDGTKSQTILNRDKGGSVSLGKGWREFAEANNLKSGDSFEVELIREGTTPMLRLVSSDSNEKESVSIELGSRDSSSAIQNRFVTLALTPEDVKACNLHLPSEFMKANGINKLGKITILGENKSEWSGYLLSRDGGTVALGSGWLEFCEANGVNLRESFTLESINKQNTTPLLKFSSQKTNLC